MTIILLEIISRKKVFIKFERTTIKILLLNYYLIFYEK